MMGNRVTKLLYSLLFISFIFSLLYVFSQYSMYLSISDGWFVFALMIASIFLVMKIKSIYSYVDVEIINFIKQGNQNRGKNEKQGTILNINKFKDEFMSEIFNIRYMILSGFLYGVTVAAVFFIYVDTWGNNPALKYVLTGYLFFVNYITGACAFCLLKYYSKCYLLSKFVVVKLWHKKHVFSGFFYRLKRNVVYTASIYNAICISSIYFSNFEYKDIVLIYSVISVIIITLSYFIPDIPIYLLMTNRKKDLLVKINSEIDSLMADVFNNDKDDNEGNNRRIIDLNHYLQIRSATNEINTGPITGKNVRSAFTLILIPSLPILLDFILTTIDFL